MKNKKNSCSPDCPVKVACWAGFLAVLVMMLTIGLSGVNYAKALGTMFLGYGVSTLSLYLVGFLIHLFFGLLFALIYVYFIAGVMTNIPAWIKGLVYGLIITIGAHLTMPIMDQIAMITRGNKECYMSTSCTYLSSTCDSKKEDNMKGNASPESNMSWHCKDTYMMSRAYTNPMKHPIQASLGQHIVYGIVLAVVVAHGCCRRED